MSETPLAKVLRLAGGVTRSYVRTAPSGQLQRVTQYANHRNVTGASGPGARGPAAIPPPKTVNKAVAFGQLKAGQIVQVHTSRYKVIKTNVPPLTTGFQGKGVNTAGPANTGSQGQNVNTGNQSPQQILLGGTTIKPGTPTMTSEWQDLAGGKSWFITLPANFPIQVVG